MIDALGIISLFLDALPWDLAVQIVLELFLEHVASLFVQHLAHLAQQHLYAIFSHLVSPLHQVTLNLLQLRVSVLLHVQVLDQLALDASLVALRWLNAPLLI